MFEAIKEGLQRLTGTFQDRKTPLVVVESPYAAETDRGVRSNIRYLKKCMRHSTNLQEAPFASHLLYTQFLDDDIEEERETGIKCGFAWGTEADRRVFYADKGISPGMVAGMKHSVEWDIPIEFRFIEYGGIDEGPLYIEVHPDDIANVYKAFDLDSSKHDKGTSCGTQKMLKDLMKNGRI
jgi:hypothetical protein